MEIRRGDKVKVITGEERGKTGKVLKVFPDQERAIVEGLNFIQRHTRPSSRQQQGGIVEKEAPIHLSNLRIVCPGCGEAKGLSIERDPDGTRRRKCKSCGEMIPAG
ncbi:50S ribosomal protein L24 [Candidatus Fermentibacteria bacterium]|nr:50S ribosomal protein L24 [Candidatus Fermentibacteria bacterium]